MLKRLHFRCELLAASFGLFGKMPVCALFLNSPQLEARSSQPNKTTAFG